MNCLGTRILAMPGCGALPSKPTCVQLFPPLLAGAELLSYRALQAARDDIIDAYQNEIIQSEGAPVQALMCARGPLTRCGQCASGGGL